MTVRREMSDAVEQPVVLSNRLRYAKYRKCSLDGIKQLPAHWREIPLKRVTVINSDKLPDSTDADDEIEYVDIGNVSLIEGITSTEHYRFEDAPSRARRRVANGDTIISTVRTYLKAVAYVANPPNNLIVSTGFAVVRPTGEFDSGYLYRLLQSEPFVQRVVAHSVGVSYPAINPSEFGGFSIPVPPLEEQQAIASFLDRETAKIDALVAKKERLIELLQEKRTALISDVVTKGLNPDAKMKESGSAWLGTIPSNWEFVRLKYAVGEDGSGVQMGPFGGMLKDLEETDTGYRVFGQENTISGNFAIGHRWVSEDRYFALRNYHVRPGDIVLTRKGSIGNARVFPENAGTGIIDSDTIRVRANPNRLFTPFLVRLLHEAWYVQTQILAVRRGAILSGLNTTTIMELCLCLPPVSEQKDIVKAVDRKASQLDRLIVRISDGVVRLREYRTALISAAVTGKIDVRTSNVPSSC